MKPSRLAVAVLMVLAAPALAVAADALRLIPADAVSVGMVRVSELRNSPIAGKIFDHTDEIATDGDARKFLREAGFDPFKDIDTVVVAVSPSEKQASVPDVLLVMEGRFDVDRLQSSIAKRGAFRVLAEGGSYYRFPEHEGAEIEDRGALAWLSRSVAIAGKETAVVKALRANARGGTDFATAGGLAHMLAKVDQNSSAWAVVDVPRAARLKGEPDFPGNSQRDAALRQALRSVSVVGVWADEGTDELSVGGTAMSNDPETLQLLEDLLRGMLAGWRLAAQEKAPELVAAIRRFDVERSAGTVSLRGSIPSDLIERFSKKHHGRQLGK